MNKITTARIIAVLIGIPIALAVFAALSLFVGYVVAIAWNYTLVPQGLKSITTLQGVGLLLLAEILLPSSPRKGAGTKNYLKGLNK